MTKAEAINLFESYKLQIDMSDKWAWWEAWNNFTDSLFKDRKISEKQYNSWENPYPLVSKDETVYY